jgi:hypothetical protein
MNDQFHNSTPSSLALSAEEQERLCQCEEVIEKGQQTIAAAGAALENIRTRKLYRPRYKSFAQYCRDSLGITDRRARQLLSAAKVVRKLKGATKAS